MELIEHLGGVADPAAPASASQLVALLRREIARGLDQVDAPRAGYDRPLVVPFAGEPGGVLAAIVPVPARLRADAELSRGRFRPLLLVAAVLDALLLVADLGTVPIRSADGLAAEFGAWEGALVITVPWARASGPDTSDAELAALAADDHLATADRLRVATAALPSGATSLVLAGLTSGRTVGPRHPLDALEVLLRAGVPPAAAAQGATGAAPPEHAAKLDAVLGAPADTHRPHEDPDPARRIARRMLQVLMGKRKWSGGTGAGFHTEVTHLFRGFDTRDRELAGRVVEALLASGLLVEKTSVGQRHVSLLSRRAGDIKAFVEHGDVPSDLHLPGR